MDALELLKSDHDKVRSLFRQFEQAASSDDSAAQADLRDKIIDELEVHTSIEEEVFYPQVREKVEETEDLVLEGVEEHHVVDQIIAEVRSMDPDEEAFEAKMTVLIENVEHHAEEEEEELFPKVRANLDPAKLAALGEELAAAKERHQSSGSSGAATTREELYEQAKEQGVEGRSTMTKDELADAVED